MAKTDDDLLAMFKEAAAIVAERPVPEATYASSLFELGIDSMAIAGIIGHMERTLDVRIEHQDLARVTTIGDLAEVFRRLRR